MGSWARYLGSPSSTSRLLNHTDSYHTQKKKTIQFVVSVDYIPSTPSKSPVTLFWNLSANPLHLLLPRAQIAHKMSGDSSIKPSR